ncbi:MAG: hypothetical protein ACK5P7_06480 [Bdellovibrio sp.]|jgi:hypothetical protein
MKRVFQQKSLNRIWESPNFYSLIPKAVLTSPLYVHFENFIVTRLVRSRIQFESRRTWLLSLGISWLAALVPLVVFAVFSHAVSYFGVWTWMWAPARLPEPPELIFLVGEARWQGLLLCAAIGFLPALVTGYGGWMWILAPAALFAGILSIPGAWMMIFAERLALWFRFLLVTGDRAARQDLFLRALLALAVVLFLAFTGPLARGVLQSIMGGAPFDPDLRFLQFGLGLAFYAAVETVFALSLLHAYFFWVRDDKTTEIWSLRLRRWQSLSDRHLLGELKRTAHQRLKELQAQDAALDPLTRAQIPPAVLRQHQKRLAELARLGPWSDENELQDKRTSRS